MSTEAQIAANTQALTKLMEAIQELATKKPEPKSVLQRPANFKGGAADARRYLRYFTLWAGSQGRPLNDPHRKDKQWICAFLSGLEGEAATWAAHHMNQIMAWSAKPPAEQDDAHFPGKGQWGTFVTEFETRFQAADDKAAAIR